MYGDNRTTRAALFALFVACLAGAGEARADAISPRPACPPGTAGRSSHAGQWCAAAPCTADTDCKLEGNSCKKWRVCEQAAMVSHNRRRPQSRKMNQVVAACAPEKKCKGDEVPPPPMVGKPEGEVVCTTGQYCVPAPLPALPVPEPEEEDADEDDEDDEEEESSTRAPKKASDGCGCRTKSAATRGSASVVVALGLIFWVRRRS